MRDGCKVADLTNYQLMQDGTPDWTNLSKRLEDAFIQKGCLSQIRQLLDFSAFLFFLTTNSRFHKNAWF
jgi:hypothetical protein